MRTTSWSQCAQTSTVYCTLLYSLYCTVEGIIRVQYFHETNVPEVFEVQVPEIGSAFRRVVAAGRAVDETARLEDAAVIALQEIEAPEGK